MRSALKYLGKSWRKNTGDPDHVLNWKAWTDLGLPRSATTIDADMRLGVPEERLSAYARCLGISPAMFGAPDTDIRFALGLPRQARAVAARPLDPGLGPLFRDDYPIYNSRQSLKDVFKLIGGVYRAYYVLNIADFVNRCALWICGVEENRILGRGFFVRFGLENFFEAAFFRWHNNLHATYLCHHGKELGHFLMADPSRHNLMARRRPFWLKGLGLTDSGLADNAPVALTCHMERLPAPKGLDQAVLWDRECEDLRRRPTIHPGDADYELLRAKVLAPDALA